MAHGSVRPSPSAPVRPALSFSFQKIAHKLKNNERQSQVVLKSTRVQKRLPDPFADLKDMSEVDAVLATKWNRAHPAVLPSEVALSNQFPAGALPTLGAVKPLRASGAPPRVSIK